VLLTDSVPPVDKRVLVSEKLAENAPGTFAETLKVPTTSLAVIGTVVATPEAFVTAVLLSFWKFPLGTDDEKGARNFTVTPLTGLPLASFTRALSLKGNAVLIWVLCGVPPTGVTVAGIPAVFVNWPVAGVPTPVADAVKVYGPPTMLFAVAVNDTCPCAFVVAEPITANVALAPLPGPAICTAIPDTALPPASLTVTTIGFANATLTAALCPPPVSVTTEAGPELFVS
jgi:hypothetical protein